MKTIKLVELELQSVGGVKSFCHNFNGEDAIVKAQNGVGKTTLYTAVLWLLFNKNTEGKTAFGIRPVHTDKSPVRGLTVSVRATFDVDGEIVTLKKINTENVGKNEKVEGFTSDYEINDVPGKLKKEFDAFVADMVSEEAFKAMTDLNYFTDLGWEKQREFLASLPDKIATPKGFEELLSQVGNRSMKEHITVLKRQRDGKGNVKGYKQEKADIPTRIDEIQQTMDGYAGDFHPDVEGGKRIQLKSQLEQIRKKRDETAKSETKRQEQFDQINAMKDKKSKIERDLKNDTSGTEALTDEKLELNAVVIEIDGKITESKLSLGRAVKDRDHYSKQLQEKITAKNKAKEDFSAAIVKLETAVENVVDTCPTCRQGLAESDIEHAKKIARKAIEDAKEANSVMIKRMNVDGVNTKAEVTAAKELIDAREKDITRLTAELQQSTEKRDARTDEIDEALKNRNTVDPTTNPVWQRLSVAITEIESGMVESVSDELEKLDRERDAKQIEVDKITTLLNQSDQIKKNADRIKEHTDREKELAQLIADIDCTLDQIDKYGKEESRLIEEAVNGKFEHVEFKLFETLLKKGIDSEPATKPTCVATYKGVSYPQLSTGQKIFVGIDIINTLCDHYGIAPFLFIDQSGEFTKYDECEFNSQVIRLQAVKGITELTVTTE